MGCDSICIKDMAGLLKPYVAEQLIRHLKKSVDIPIALHCHATTGMSTATILKASEAGIDMVDTSISSMSMTYGHSPTESVVSILEDTDRDTGIDIKALENIAAYFKEVKKKYAKFAGSLQGVDSRILVAQVPGGMLTNMESQLKDQNALDKMDEVLKEIPRVRKDLGYIPLVTPTSQIVGTQAVMNVMFGERYKSISKETAGILKGEYGATAAPVNEILQKKVLEGAEPITVRPADLLPPEMDKLTDELLGLASKENIQLADDVVDDVLTYALFPQVGLKFLKNRHNPKVFEPVPGSEATDSDEQNPLAPASQKASVSVGDSVQYRVVVNSLPYEVEVSPLGSVSSITTATSATIASVANISGTGKPLPAPLSGNILKILVNGGQPVGRGDVLLILEAMKMETEVRAVDSGNVSKILVKEGDTVQVGDPLMTIA
jgi:oxaloacetate decarboxylase alpha subunit